MVEVREIQIVTSRGPSDQLDATSSINGFPSIHARYHMSAGGVPDAVGTAAVEAAAADQMLMFEPRTSPDTSIFVSDGKGGELSFQGLLAMPSHEVGVSGIGSSFTCIHTASLLDVFDPSIYQIKSPPSGGGVLSTTASSIAGRVQEMLDTTIQAWSDTSKDARIRGTADSDALDDAIHEQNEKVRYYVNELLSNSVESTTFPTLSRLTKNKNVNLGLNAQIQRTIFNSSTSFFVALQSLMAQWQLFYAPVKGAGVGRIRQMSDILVDPEKKGIACSLLLLNAGPSGSMPVTQVIVSSTVGHAPKNSEQMSRGARPGLVPKQIAAHPSRFQGGRVSRSPLPPFLGYLTQSGTPAAGGLSAEEYRTQRDSAITDIEDYTASDVKAFAEAWAKNHYIDSVLSPCTATLTCEFDLSWEAGKSYEVEVEVAGANGDRLGHALFKGLLNSERHSVVISKDGGRVVTTLMFTHILLLENTLPT